MDNSVYVIYGDDGALLIRECFQKIGFLKNLFSENDQVLLKPNLLIPKTSDTGATTDPNLVEQLVIELRKLGVEEISIAEGAWLGASTGDSFKVCGYEEIAREFNLKLIDLKEDDYIQLPVKTKNSTMKHIKVSKTIHNATKIINLPVLKAHCQTKLTCGMKNFMGVISDNEKRRFHRLNLDNAIFELNTLVKPSLNICDAIIGDLTFEEGGTPIKFGSIFLSTDVFSFDIHAANLLGFNINDIKYLKLYQDYYKKTSDIKVEKLNAPEEIRDFKAIDYQTRFQSNIKVYDACCSCLASVFTALETSGLDSDKLNFYLGTKLDPKNINSKTKNIILGSCNKKHCQLGIFVDGCPPTGDELKKIIKNI